MELAVTKSTSNPLRVDGNITVQCKWSTEYKDSKYPFLGQTSIKLLWKDVRDENFVPVCNVFYEGSALPKVQCNSEASHLPKFESDGSGTEGRQTINVANIRYQAEVKCSLTIHGDSPVFSPTKLISVSGKSTMTLMIFCDCIHEYPSNLYFIYKVDSPISYHYISR